MKIDWANELAEYFENNCMYDSATPFTELPNTRGNCLALSCRYVDIAAAEFGINYPKVCLLNIGSSTDLEHAVVYGDTGEDIPWVVDLAYGITSPLPLNGYRRYFSFEDKGEEGVRLNLGTKIYRMDPFRVLVSPQQYSDLQYAYQLLSPKFSVFPVYSAGVQLPFAVKVEYPTYHYKRWGNVVVRGEFDNGHEDDAFQQLTEMFFTDMRMYYGDSIPFTSEDEFLNAVDNFLNWYPGLSSL